MTTKDYPLVTVGIPTLGRDKVLLDTIGSVLSQDYPSYELIVADQTLDHDETFLNTLKEIKKDKRLRYYRVEPENLPAARNFILAKARGILTLFVDDDMKFKKNFIATHVKEHTDHPEVSVVTGRIEQKGLPVSDFPLYFDKYGLPQGTFNCPNSGPCQTIPGGNHSAKTDVLKKNGGYHTAYKYDAVREESDISHRLYAAGYKMYYSAEAAATHLLVSHGGSRIYKEQFDNFRFYVNDLLFMLRTVKLYRLPWAIFRRLRIYTGGPLGRRFKRTGIFASGFVIALWLLIFERQSFAAREVKRGIK